VIGILSGSASGAARELGHTVAFSVTLTIMVFLVAYMFYRTRFREPPALNKWGPFALVCVAAILVVADPLRQFGMDHGLFGDELSMYPDEGCDSETLKCLTAVGWVFTICTWLGFTLLIWGTMWNANMMDKLRDIREKWRELRAPPAAAYVLVEDPPPRFPGAS